MQSERKIFHYQLFSGVEHGFALRGDPNDPYQRESSQSRRAQANITNHISSGWVKEQSLAGIIGWFNYWLSR